MNSTRCTFALTSALLILLTACSSKPKRATPHESHAPFYHRIDQGYRLDSVTPSQFEETINTQLLPLFPQAKPHGLSAYRPAIPVNPTGCSLPAEVALLTFQNEDIYGNYSDTDIGKKIRDAHTLVFDPNRSKSLVPEAYEGRVEVDHAYSLNQAFSGYSPAASALMIYCDPEPSRRLLAELTQIYQPGSTAQNILFTVSPTHLIEYIFATNEAELEEIVLERRERFSALFNKSMLIRLRKQELGSTFVRTGQGLDAQW